LHELDLRFILGSEWKVVPGTVTGEAVSCIIQGPRHLSLRCGAKDPLTLTIMPTEISRAYASSLAATCIGIHTAIHLPAVIQTEVEWEKTA